MPPAPRHRQSAPPVPPGLSYDDYKEELSASTLQRAVRARSPENKRAAARGKSLGPNASLPMAGGRDVASADARKGRMSVGVRVRPLSAKEEGRGSHACLEVTEGKHIFAYDPDEKMGGIDYLRLDKSKDKSYAFDCAYGPECTSEDVYEGTTKRVIRAVIDGFHGSCFAYGATGSGKTYTMLGDEAMPGVMPRAIRDLFAFAEQEDDWTWRFSMTYIEIYNERVKDLLNPMTGTDLDVREDARKGTVIAGAVEVAVSSLQELMELMNRGSLYRTTEATNCNEVSSRSHAVLQITCSGVEKYLDGTGPTKKQLSKLSMIDLAGSERAYKTDNTGQRLREGRNINRSLLSLANCINALADRTKKSTSHVPYRDSKLTRLLRDSLSGTSVSVMLCAVSPASDQFEETLNTLKYANRAKSMSPPQMPQRQVQEYNPVAEQVEVLKELKESLIPIMTKMTASP